MIYCSLCKREIKIKDLSNAFQITLGNIVNGDFMGKEIIFYHKDCLIDNKSLKTEATTQFM